MVLVLVLVLVNEQFQVLLQGVVPYSYDECGAGPSHRILHVQHGITSHDVCLADCMWGSTVAQTCSTCQYKAWTRWQTPMLVPLLPSATATALR
jgi:hypothetical protein